MKRNTNLKSLKASYPDVVAAATAQVPAIKLGQPEYREVTTRIYTTRGHGPSTPGVMFFYTSESYRTKTYTVTGSGELVPTCGMCEDGYRPEYAHSDEGVCYHCGGSNTGRSKGFATVEEAADNFRKTCQRDISYGRRFDILHLVYEELASRFLAANPGFAAAKETYEAMVEEEARAMDKAEGGMESMETYRALASGKVSKFLYDLTCDFHTNSRLTDRQVAAFVTAVDKITARREAAKAEREASSHFGTLGERIKLRATVTFGRTVESEFGTSVLMIVEGEGKASGSKFKVFSGADWAWDAFEAWEEAKEAKTGELVTVQVSGTVREHEDSRYDGAVTVLGNARKVKKI